MRKKINENDYNKVVFFRGPPECDNKISVGVDGALFYFALIESGHRVAA